MSWRGQPPTEDLPHGRAVDQMPTIPEGGPCIGNGTLMKGDLFVLPMPTGHGGSFEVNSRRGPMKAGRPQTIGLEGCCLLNSFMRRQQIGSTLCDLRYNDFLRLPLTKTPGSNADHPKRLRIAGKVLNSTSLVDPAGQKSNTLNPDLVK